MKVNELKRARLSAEEVTEYKKRRTHIDNDTTLVIKPRGSKEIDHEKMAELHAQMHPSDDIALDRCKNDPLYAIFMYPNSTIDSEDFGQVTVLDYVLKGMLKVLESAHGEDVFKTPQVEQYVTSLRMGINASGKAIPKKFKLYAILFTMSIDNRAYDFIEALYRKTETSLRGTENLMYMRSEARKFVDHIEGNVYNVSNMRKIIEEFIEFCSDIYFSNPMKR